METRINQANETTTVLSVLPVKNTVLFPYLFIPLSAGRPSSMAAVEAAAASEEKTLLVVAQRDCNVDLPAGQDLFQVGTKAVIKKMARSENSFEFLVQGIERMTIEEIVQTEPFLKAKVKSLPLPT